MKAVLFFFFLPAFCFSQVEHPGYSGIADSAKVVKEVNALIQKSLDRALLGAFEQALAINATAEQITLERFGWESESYGSCCHNHGRILCMKGDFAEAEQWNLEAKSIREKVLGKEDPDYALTLNNTAEMYRSMGEYEKAEPLYGEAINIWLKVDDRSNYAMTTFNYANYYVDMGQYEMAQKLYVEAKNIWAITLGKTDPKYLSSLNNLAALYYKMGNYAQAEPLYLEAKTTWGEKLRMKNAYYAGIVTNLAALYSAIDQYEKAEPLFLEAKAIYEKAPGKQPVEYAFCLTNFAMLYFSTEQFDKAELLYLESKSILERYLGKEHLYYIVNLNNLAALYKETGKDKKAETLYLQAVDLLAKKPGKEHPVYATAILNLAMLYYEIGKFKKAEPLCLEAKSIREETLGKEHPDYAASLNNLSVLYISMDNNEKAESLLLELSIVNQTLMGKARQHLSEREQSIYILKFASRQDLTLSFAQRSARQTITPACYDNALFYKGFLLHAANRITRLAHTDSLSTDKYYRLKGYVRRLGDQYALSKSERDSATVAELEEKADALEKDLARTVAGFGEAMQQVYWQDVQEQLKPGEAAIEFVHYYYYDPKPLDSTMYAALVLKPGEAAPLFITLFEERQIAPMLKNTSNLAIGRINALYGSEGNTTLYNLIWKPLEPHLQGVKTVYCAPSGLLHRLNLGAIAPNGQEVMNDRYRVVTLGSTRRLVLPDAASRTGTEAVLIGGVRYAADNAAIKTANEGIEARDWDDWDYLPGSACEVSDIQNILQSANWSANIDTGYYATEEAFRSFGEGKRSPRILHISTHGFFFPDPESSSHFPLERGPEGGAVFKFSDHPMIRSGLLLAGANETWSTGHAPENREDGILTAYEISQMNLSNTELVVLSACQTGLGEIDANEGVYGLQRAFKIAGAKYLMMSLWKVSDQTTGELMMDFYQQWLVQGLDIPEAFRTAQHNMKQKYPDSPYLWAGFVLVE